MAKHPNPQARTLEGRTVVNRDWMAERTGASRVTVNLWYAKRDEQPEDARHPEKAITIERVDFYDKEEFETFYAGLQERKKKKLLPTDPALYDGDLEDHISINLATEWFHFAGAGVIRKYLRDNPGYFPEPVGTVEGPTGRQIPAFRRGDLQDFDRKRTGDNTGAAGRPSGPQVRSRKPETERRIAAAADRLRKDGYRRGIAAELATEHNEPTWQWERAVKEARDQLSGDAH
ncbi:hypothetical protein OHA27_37990 [Streptomyces sp. NBC_01619]|uniref:hypothetical protein n=1 Tax=Streptomyces sp. NBC_01619 TaxID=2975901 RepID=UPI00225257CA|nr:hypothetical protein [Streptomyces sp. NBC_01619]MCX4515913.1 hypothetical protein [Streptomyces sp. NBC_01619]